MGKRCVVAGCSNSSSSGLHSMHLFPREEKLFKKWEKFVKLTRLDWKATKYSVICSEHFLPECYMDNSVQASLGFGPKNRQLLPNSIPSVLQPTLTTRPTESEIDQNNDDNSMPPQKKLRSAHQRREHRKKQKVGSECALSKKRKLCKREKTSAVAAIESDNIGIPIGPDHAHPYNVLALQPMMADMETPLPSTYSVAPEFIANVNRNPIGSTVGQITAIDSRKHQTDVFPAVSAPNIALNTTSVTGVATDGISHVDRIPEEDQAVRISPASIPPSVLDSTCTDPAFKDDQTKMQFTWTRDAPECPLKREGKSTAKTFIGRDINASERLLQTVPGAVEVRLVVKPDDHLVTLRCKLGSILHAEVVENDQYYLDLEENHLVKLRRHRKNPIKTEKPDPEYEKARLNNSHVIGDLNSLEERSEVRSTDSGFSFVQTLNSTPDISNTGTQPRYDPLIRHCRSLNFSRSILPNSMDYRFVVPVSNQSQLNYASGISTNADVVGSNAPVVNQNVIYSDVCHTTGLSRNLAEQCNSHVVNPDLSQTCTAGWQHNVLSPCNLQVANPGLSHASAENLVEQCKKQILNPILDETHPDTLSENVIEQCNSREVNSELCQTSAGDISGNNSAEPCNSQFLSPVLHRPSAKTMIDTAAEEQFGVLVSSSPSKPFIYKSGPVDIFTEKQFQESHIIPVSEQILSSPSFMSGQWNSSLATRVSGQTSSAINVNPELCDSSSVNPESECFTSTTGTKFRGDALPVIAGSTIVTSESGNTLHLPEQYAQPVMIPSVDQTLNTTSGLPEQCSKSTFISGSEQTMHSESNHSDQDDHGAQHPDLLLEADNIDSITGLPQTTMGPHQYIKYKLQAKQLLAHSYSFEARGFRLGYLNTKEDKLSPGPIKKHPGKMISPKNAVSRSHGTEGYPAERHEGTLEGDVETHFECEYCDFATSDWDQFVRHMKESHQINMGDRNPRAPSLASDVDDEETLSADTSTEDMETITDELVDQEKQLNDVVNINPNDLIEKETDNERDVYKCKECSYTFKRETAALSHVKMQHLNKEAALYYGKTSRADTEKDVKRQSNRCSRSSDESFSLSECSASSETDDSSSSVSISDEESSVSTKESQKKDNKSKFAKAIEDGGTEWLECTLCGDRWATMESLYLHLSACHNIKRTNGKRKPRPKNTICDLCGEKCSSLSNHKRNKHKSKSQQEAFKEYCRNYLKKMRLESGPLLCPKHGCNTMLANRRCWRVHIREVHGPKVKCDICGKMYGTKLSLRKHKDAVHRGVRNYVCTWPDCDKVFSSLWHLRVHMRIHTNEKPLQCELCGFRARQSNSLRYHFEKHHKAKSPSSDDKM